MEKKKKILKDKTFRKTGAYFGIVQMEYVQEECMREN